MKSLYIEVNVPIDETTSKLPDSQIGTRASTKDGEQPGR